MFVQQLLEHTESERNKLRELLVRHFELEKLERSIVEVRDMFLRISTLVIEQVRIFTQFKLNCSIKLTVYIKNCLSQFHRAH